MIIKCFSLPVWSAKGHSSIINSIDGATGKESTNNQDHLVVTGSRDGSVKVLTIVAVLIKWLTLTQKLKSNSCLLIISILSNYNFRSGIFGEKKEL